MDGYAAIAPLSGLLLLVWSISLLKKKPGNIWFQVVPWSVTATWLLTTLLASMTVMNTFKSLETTPVAEKSHTLAVGIANASEIVVHSSVVSCLLFVYLFVISLVFRKEKIESPRYDFERALDS